MATIKKSLASGNHNLLKAGEMSDRIKAITICASGAGASTTVSLYLHEDGGSSFFILRNHRVNTGSVYVIDNPNILSYDKNLNDLSITLSATSQVVIYT